MTLNTLYTALVSSFKDGEPILTVREIAVLLHLRTHLNESTGSISEALHVPKPATSRAIDMLEGCGLAVRKRFEDDLRTNRVRLTLSGIAYLNRLERRLAPAKTKEAA